MLVERRSAPPPARRVTGCCLTDRGVLAREVLAFAGAVDREELIRAAGQLDLAVGAERVERTRVPGALDRAWEGDRLALARVGDPLDFTLETARLDLLGFLDPAAASRAEVAKTVIVATTRNRRKLIRNVIGHPLSILCANY